MWYFIQTTGELLKDGILIGVGYSGKGAAKNNPLMQDVHNVGPIPAGDYSIGQPYDTETHGPFVLPLTPDSKNKMFGRSQFLIHGDSILHPGEASEGCIIYGRIVRERINKSLDRRLSVLPIWQV